MRMLLLLFCVLTILKDIWCKNDNGTTVNTNIGETVLLPCDVDGFVLRLRWRKGRKFLTQDFDVNILVNGYDRLKIDTNNLYNLANISVYNLVISNVTSEDFGDYWCVVQGSDTKETCISLTQSGSTKKISNDVGTNTDSRTATPYSFVTEELTFIVTAGVNTGKSLLSPVYIYIIVCFCCSVILLIMTASRTRLYKLIKC